MTAAFLYTELLRSEGLLEQTSRVQVELFGSLGVTGHGHGTVKAILLGLEGSQPHLVDPTTADERVARIGELRSLALGGTRAIAFDPKVDLILHRRQRLEYHINGMRFQAFGGAGDLLNSREYFSVGGGFVLDENQIGAESEAVPRQNPPSPERIMGYLARCSGSVFTCGTDWPHSRLQVILRGKLAR
jgi:L-serine dehydratase